jgi:hypothetical protein
VVVILHAPDQPEAVLDQCAAGTTYGYNVPTGSTIVLSPSTYMYTWNDPACTGTNSCVMNGDRSVLVTAASYDY